MYTSFATIILNDASTAKQAGIFLLILFVAASVRAKMHVIAFMAIDNLARLWQGNLKLTF
jgi:hypothetical protein